jgi:4-hydroxy-2-oxoheptanedioate aldolase
MTGDKLRERLRGDAPYYFGWCGLPGPLHAEAMARLPFEGVCIDMQHGLVGFADVAVMCPVIGRLKKTSIVRVLWNEPALVGQALDAGAQIVISPMINTPADAKALVRGGRYVPQGGRSWGAYAASLFENITREEYLRRGNELSILFAMIETQEALDNLDAIAAVDGIDGLFVGPSDLTISLTGGKSVDSSSELTKKAMEKIAAAAKKHNRAAGVFGANGPFCVGAARMGYRFISAVSDTNLLSLGAKAFLDSTKG